jgi:2-oxoglutarate ferredoxin oxidoreductase subunit alpha
MALLETAPESSALAHASGVVNNFSLVVATTNGTGSQTSNLALLRALFKMGIPVNGKNIFPSNIQGAPTWYHIRISREGYVARSETADLLVAFNEKTFLADLQKLPSGGVCLYNGDWRTVPSRNDITFYSVPVRRFVGKSGVTGKLRDYMGNMVYLGAIAQLLDIPIEAIGEALDHLLGSRAALVEPNLEIATAAHSWTAVNIDKNDPYRVIEMNETAGKIVITGNEAAALGAVFGGVSVVAWYPITPSTSIIDNLNKHLPNLRRDAETGKATYALIQAEDELAAIGIVLGAGWAGARAMTATSGPGISLMSEFAGLGYYAEIPAVIWDVQRVGPSTGLPTRSSQGDVISTYYLGHGDTKNVILFPGSVKECFEFGVTAFDLADSLQTPIFVLSDLDLGMNQWMSEPFEYPAEPINRGKVLTAEDIDKVGFIRYKDIDGDGIGYRTFPGNKHPQAAWLARGTGHSEAAVYSEKPQDFVDGMHRLSRKFDTARDRVPGPIIDDMDGANVGIIAYGTTQYAIEEARDRMAAQGVRTSFMRLRALPVSEQVEQFIGRFQHLILIEQNHDGQMRRILGSELPNLAARLSSLAHIDGMPLTADWVVARINELLVENAS